jgi:iron complex outermembrane receptor protein
MNYALTTRARLAGSVAFLALSAGAAMAQQAVEQVVVSSTRLQAAGFNSPTPTTVVSTADLEASAKTTVFETIAQLPELMGSTGTGYNTQNQSNGLMGLSALGLRGLSPIRTLTLLDSQRVVPANLNGVVDVSLMPQMLLQRVDVVTGGASASWGSDAVAGVINFVTDKKFEGFKMNATAGESTYSDMGNINIQAAAGTSFWGGRGHYEIAAEFAYNDGMLKTQASQAVSDHPTDFGGRNLWYNSTTANFGNPAVNAAGQTTANPTTCFGSAAVGCTNNGQTLAFAGTNTAAPQYFYGRMAQNGYQSGQITTGPLAGTSISGNGQPFQFQLAGACAGQLLNGGGGGKTVGSFNGQCFGTPAQPGDQTADFNSTLVMPLTRGNIYQRVSYDLSPNAEIYATLTWSEARTQTVPGNSGASIGTRSVNCDNAFLPSANIFGVNLSAAATLAACNALYPAAGGTAGSAPIGPGLGTQSLAGLAGSFGFSGSQPNIPNMISVQTARSLRRYVVGGDGNFDLFGKNWSWTSYFEHGETGMGLRDYGNALAKNGFPALNAAGNNVTTVSNGTRTALAQDAVFNASGQIVCRNTIAQLNGCTPLNEFLGSAPPPLGATQYVLGQNVAEGTRAGSAAIQTTRQEAFSFAVNGSPIEDWAGPVAVAAGYEYREEHYSQRGDPYGAGISASTPATVNEPCTDPAINCSALVPGSWAAGNYANGRGTYHVNEVFVETGVPLLNDTFWGKMDLELAGRHARYSTAGDANTWKVGLTWDTPIPGIRLRALQSRDVRAPSLQEIAPPLTGVNVNINNDFQAGRPSLNILGQTTGNPALKPERSQTTEAGIVWQPDFIPGLQMSVDYFRIAVQGYSVQLSAQQVEDQCFNGNATFCSQNVIRTANGVNQDANNPGGPPAGSAAVAANQITAIVSAPFNAASVVTDGFDIEAGYAFDLQDYDVPGQFTLRSLASHISKWLLNNGPLIPNTMPNQEFAGYINSSRVSGPAALSYGQSGGTVFTWKLDETQSYQNDVWGINLTERWLAPGTSQVKNFIVCQPGTCPSPTFQQPTINFDKVDAVLYLDVGVNWHVNDKTQLYVKVDNVTNIMPPDDGLNTPANDVYDVIGRMYRVGVRFNY